MKPNIRTASCILLASAALSHSAHSAVLYSEAFPNNVLPVSEQPTSSIGWVAYVGTSAAAASNNASTPPRWVISNATGAGVGSPNGYLFNQFSGTTTIGVAFVNNPFSILPANITNFSFVSANTSASDKSRFIVQQNGNWFVSDTELGTEGTQANLASATPLSLAFTLTGWKSLTINPTMELSIGPAATLSGTAPINSIGFYSTGSSVMRFDELTINGVPEPTSLLLTALALPVLLRRKR